MNNTVKIYSLKDPITNEIRYIGKTIQTLNTRLSKHVNTCFYRRTYKECWIYSLFKKGKKPLIELVEETTSFDWETREKYWIKFYEGKVKLTNLSEGGIKGGFGKGYTHTEITRKKISMALLGRKQTPYQKQRAKEANSKPKTAIHKKNLSFGKTPQNIKDNLELIFNLIENEKKTYKQVADTLGVSLTAVWRVYNKKLKWQT